MFCQRWIDRFKWESPEQEKGYFAFVKWAMFRKLSFRVRPIDLYFIQKDHESDVYWRELVGSQIRSLEDQIRLLQEELRTLQMSVKLQKLKGKK